MRIHELKTWPIYFNATLCGDKAFDIRKDDRGFNIDDVLFLREFDQRTGEYTGRKTFREITSIVYGGLQVAGRPGVPDPSGGLALGYVILGHSFISPESVHGMKGIWLRTRPDRDP